MGWKDRENLEEGDLLVSTVTHKQAESWGVDHGDGECGPFGYWLQVCRGRVAGQIAMEPIARFTSREAAVEWSLATKDDVTVWLEE